MKSTALPLGADGDRLLRETWQYWREPAGNVVELGLVRGQDVALPAHFHDEDQITFVMSGKRRFVIGDEIVEIVAGESVNIPAGTPHRSLSDSTDVFCINVYVSPRTYEASGLMSDLHRLWRSSLRIGQTDHILAFQEPRSLAETCARPDGREGICIDQWETVCQAAHRAGMSREGFSRRFKRLQGLPPQEFRLLHRLNDARRLLRAGEPIAAVAAQTGFSDQSHLGRCFRRFFGVTPGRYRNGSVG